MARGEGMRCCGEEGVVDYRSARRGRLGAVCAEVPWVRFVHPLRAALRSHASPSRSEGEDLLFALSGRLLENIGS